jgi:HK97 family phage major capsid protein
MGAPTWTAEIKTGSEDSSLDFDKRTLTPHPLARRIKVSNDLLRQAVLNVDAIVRQRLAYQFGVVEENAYLNGNGSNQPLGVFTASDNGIGTARDVSTGNTTTAIKADNLIECKYTLKSQYMSTAVWIFHRDTIKKVRQLKTGDGDYLWKQGISADRPDTILDRPYYMSEYAPSTFTASSYVGIIGDFSFYWIADALDMTIQVLSDLYAETNQSGYIGRKATDGMPVLAEAFVRVKLAAS